MQPIVSENKLYLQSEKYHTVWTSPYIILQENIFSCIKMIYSIYMYCALHWFWQTKVWSQISIKGLASVRPKAVDEHYLIDFPDTILITLIQMLSFTETHQYWFLTAYYSCRHIKPSDMTVFNACLLYTVLCLFVVGWTDYLTFLYMCVRSQGVRLIAGWIDYLTFLHMVVHSHGVPTPWFRVFSGRARGKRYPSQASIQGRYLSETCTQGKRTGASLDST